MTKTLCVAAMMLTVRAAAIAQDVPIGLAVAPDFNNASTIPRAPERSGEAVKDSDEQAKIRRVEMWFVPHGGKAPASACNYQNASTLPVSALGCPK